MIDDGDDASWLGWTGLSRAFLGKTTWDGSTQKQKGGLFARDTGENERIIVDDQRALSCQTARKPLNMTS